QMDDLTRGYLRDLAELRFLPAPVRLPLASTNRFLTLGFLPQRFRDELGYSWTPRDQRRFDRLTRNLARVNAVLPRPARVSPFNCSLWAFRRRVKAGRPIVCPGGPFRLGPVVSALSARLCWFGPAVPVASAGRPPAAVCTAG